MLGVVAILNHLVSTFRQRILNRLLSPKESIFGVGVPSRPPHEIISPVKLKNYFGVGSVNCLELFPGASTCVEKTYFALQEVT